MFVPLCSSSKVNISLVPLYRNWANKANNKINEHRAIFQRESQNS